MPRGGRRGLDDLFQELTGSAWVLIGLIVVIGIGVWIVSWIRSRLAGDEGSATEDHRLLSQIADLKQQGDLTEEEYRSIKGRLIERIDDSVTARGEKAAARSVSETAKPNKSANSEHIEGTPESRGAVDD